MGGRKRRTRRWIAEKRRDPYTRRARESGYRSRAVFKLQEIDEQDRLFARARRVLDLGSAPGGWSQYARNRVTGGAIVAVDIQAMAPIEGVDFVQGDFRQETVQARLLALTSPHPYDLVISDLAPNITGIADVDQANASELAQGAIALSARVLAKNGALVLKLFEGSEAVDIRHLGGSMFRSAVVRKPRASRDRSREIYLVLRGPRG